MDIESLTQLDSAALVPTGGLFPSPIAWEDQVFYFLMLDRFSDGNEKGYKDNAGTLVPGGTAISGSPCSAANLGHFGREACIFSMKTIEFTRNLPKF